MCNREKSLHDIAKQIGMFWGSSVYLGQYLRDVQARWVHRMLTKEQKKSSLDISKYLLSLYEDDPEEFMHRCDPR